ncbi:hypothetical protein ABPG75_009190 [Micractinium tetrahymenae]
MGADHGDPTPLAVAAARERVKCMEALLAAGADPMACSSGRFSAMHAAAIAGSVPAMRLLLAGHPEAAIVEDGIGRIPLSHELPRHSNMSAAKCLLEEGAPPPADKALALLAKALIPLGTANSMAVQPLYAALVARQPLTAEQWAQVPSPCAGLGAALPAVLERSTAEAALLVQHLCAEERARLRAAAICLSQGRGLPALPTPLLLRVLALALAI